MQSKSTRGIQQDDVWAAADALIAEGLRPTIERVRQKIGRGSPNTVSPMLEAWFATLGPRLGVSGTKEEEGDLPAPVRQGMTKLWDTALQSARQDAARALDQAQQALAEDRAALEVWEADLARQEQVLTERQVAADEALQVARSQIADLTTRLDESHAMLGRRDSEIDDLRSGLTIFEKQRDEDRRHSAEEAKRHADERRRLEERAAASERRLLEDIDRERQEAKQAKAALGDIVRRAEASRQRLEGVNKSLGDKLQERDVELRSVHQALASANERSSELRALLDEQRAATGLALAQFNQILADVARKPPAVGGNRKRAARMP
ncbi:DNA-binding protein [Rhodoferax ferrireducens]|uniref:DNA-binding protein n=1 Tax=Rhodoferax ferrireducens TaxID=192843 RepID=UPI00298E109C|nr:DNA-binding protein [Rhodoferax ferrireducens]WPC65147.1 DNA-binding protein [Rhodoferax ferrireducens]